MDYLREKYIPFLVKEVIANRKPITENDFIEFSQALYDQLRKKEKSIKQIVHNELGMDSKGI